MLGLSFCTNVGVKLRTLISVMELLFCTVFLYFIIVVVARDSFYLLLTLYLLCLILTVEVIYLTDCDNL